MADRPTETRPMRDMLASIDRDIANMPPPVRREERSFAEQQRVADLTGDVLRKAAEDTIIAVTQGLDSIEQSMKQSTTEAETRVAALRKKAEEAMAQLKNWTDDFARQNTELIEKCTALESSINETVQHIIQIGQKPLNGSNSRGDPNENR